MNQVDPELLKRIDALAAKMGIAAGQMWQILLHQARIEALKNGLFAALFLSGALGCVYIAYVFKVKGKIQDEYYLLATVALIAAAGFLSACIFNLCSTFSEFFNPGYWALQQLHEVF